MIREPWYWRNLTLFDNASQVACDALYAVANELLLRKEQIVFRPDDPSDRIYLVEQGLIKVFSLAPQGELITLWFCGAGEPFGAGGIAGEGPQSVFAQAVGPARVLSVGRNDFERVIEQHPRLALNTIRLVSGRLRLACDAFLENVSHPPGKRLARMLLRLACQCAKPTESGFQFQIRLTHQELAQMIGSSRQTVNRILGQYTNDGLICLERRMLVIRQPEQLAALAGI